MIRHATRYLRLPSVAAAFVLALAFALLLPATSHLQETAPGEAETGGKAAALASSKGKARGEASEAAAGGGGDDAEAGKAGAAEDADKAAETDKPAKADKADTAAKPSKGEDDHAAAAPKGEHAGLTASNVTPTLGAPPAAKEGCPLCPVSNKEEIEVLMQLRERHTLLAARENIVAQKEIALAKLEDALDGQLARLDVAMNKIEARLDIGEARRAKRDAQLKALVETLQGLSAKKAAPMLAEAKPEFVAEIFRQLGPVRTASMLAVMPASKAGKLIDLAVEAGVPVRPPAGRKPSAAAPAAPAPPNPASPGAAAPADDAAKPGDKP